MYRRNVCVCYTAIAVNAYRKAPSADSQWALNKCYGTKVLLSQTNQTQKHIAGDKLMEFENGIPEKPLLS